MAIDFVALQEYLTGLVPSRPPELEAMETDAAAHNFPIIGAATGQLCYLMTRLMGARQVFELGSGFGYSTAWFARGVLENGGGTVHHVVWDQALSDRARGHLDRLGLGGVVQYVLGEAVETLERAAGPFDIIFNDIEKQDYPASLSVIKSKLRPGGLLIIDNMLWYGRIFDPQNRTPATEGVRTMTRLLSSDPDWIVSLVPVRDGVILAAKR